MERPDITKPLPGEKPIGGPGMQYRLVARTQSIEEANRIAEQYEMKGFKTQIVKKRQGTISIYEVWIAKEPDVFSGTERPAMK
jgi:hypothetical protein